MKPRVSVVIPYYNTAAVVAETLDSVFAQTYRDFEVILVNDGSPDTAELERVLQSYLDKITYIRKEGGGVSSARNQGIGVARGELIALIDSDDVWMPDYLEVQVAQLDADPLADVVFPNAVTFGAGENGRRLAMDPAKPLPDVTFTALATVECFVVVSVLARKTAIERAGMFDESLSRCEDFDLWLRCLKAGSRIICHHKVLLRYRRRPGSLSWDRALMTEHAAKVLRKMLVTVPLTDQERLTLQRQAGIFDGNQLFFESKKAFLEADYPTAIARLEAAGQRLQEGRARRRMVMLLLRTAPGLARTVYCWWYSNVPNL